MLSTTASTIHLVLELLIRFNLLDSNTTKRFTRRLSIDKLLLKSQNERADGKVGGKHSVWILYRTPGGKQAYYIPPRIQQLVRVETID